MVDIDVKVALFNINVGVEGGGVWYLLITAIRINNFVDVDYNSGFFKLKTSFIMSQSD